ncbi:hypothetical protein MCERE19_02597 [Spirosomataceae bacterium]
MKTTKSCLLDLCSEETWIEALDRHTNDIFLSIKAYENGFELILESFNDGRDGFGTGSSISSLAQGNEDYSYIFKELIDWKSVLIQITQSEGLVHIDLSNITGNTPNSVKSLNNQKIPAWIMLFIWFFLNEYQEQNPNKRFDFDRILLNQ